VAHRQFGAVAANVLPTSLILFTLMMEATRSSETSVLTRATQHHVSENGILHSYRRENLKSYIAFQFHSKKLHHSFSRKSFAPFQSSGKGKMVFVSRQSVLTRNIGALRFATECTYILRVIITECWCKQSRHH
jgi:hypothetical protein